MSGDLFHTISGADWKRGLHDARARPNVAAEQIRQATDRSRKGAGPWISGRFFLPQSQHMPVEVDFEDGRTEERHKVEGSWQGVKRWRQL